ncbi:histidine phosphatase family protein [soil metagenome]
MTPTIYFARHGETEWNSIRRVQGALDSPLTAKGRDQARDVGRILLDELGYKPDYRLVASPRGRALETAGFIAEALGLTIKTDERLTEVTLGSWDGLTRDEIDRRIGPGFADPTGEAWHFEAPDGESFAAARQRVSSWLDEIDCNTIAAGHGLSGKILRGIYADLDEVQSLALAEPQGEVFRMKDGAIARLSLAGVVA